MANRTAMLGAAALGAGLLLNDILSTPRTGPEKASTVVSDASETSIDLPKSSPGSARARLPMSGIAFLTDPVVADRAECKVKDGNEACIYRAFLTVQNDRKTELGLELKANLVSAGGMLLEVAIDPPAMTIPKLSIQTIDLSFTPESPACASSWKWSGWSAGLRRPASTHCIPAQGYLAAKFPRDPTGDKKGDKKEDEQRILGVEIATPAPSSLEGFVLLATAGIAGFLTVCMLSGLGIAGVLRNVLGPASFEFDRSFASSIGFTGLLVTLAGWSAVVPAVTQLMNKSSYGALSAFAAALVLLSPMLYNLGSRRVQVEEGDSQIVGRVYVFAFAAGLLTWGATLQLATFWLQWIEVREARVITDETFSLVSWVLVAVAVALWAYVPASVIQTSRHDSKPVQMEEIEEVAAAAQPAPAAAAGQPLPAGESQPATLEPPSPDPSLKRSPRIAYVKAAPRGPVLP